MENPYNMKQQHSNLCCALNPFNFNTLLTLLNPKNKLFIKKGRYEQTYGRFEHMLITSLTLILPL